MIVIIYRILSTWVLLVIQMLNGKLCKYAQEVYGNSEESPEFEDYNCKLLDGCGLKEFEFRA